MGAWGSAQVATVVLQLASLPIFLSYWSMATYGTWLTLTTIPAYLGLADIGFITAASNKMIAFEAVGKHRESNVAFQSAILFITWISAGLMVVSVASVYTLAHFYPQLHDYASAIIVLTVSVVISLFASLAQTVYVATQGFATGTYLFTISRVLDFVGAVVGLIVGGTFLSVALGAVLMRGAFSLLFIYWSHTRSTHLKWGLRHASGAELKESFRPATLFLVFPVASALSLQGFTILVTATLGPVATTVFSSYRTIARIVVQAAGTLSQTMWPEFSHMHSTQEVSRLRRTYTNAARLSAGIGFLVSLAVFAVSPYLIEYWSKGHIVFSWSLMAGFMVYALIASMWHVPRVMLMSINEHGLLARQYLIASVLSIGVGALLAREVGLMGPVIAMVGAEAGMWLASRRTVSGLWQGAST